jgi:hypothetical protein
VSEVIDAPGFPAGGAGGGGGAAVNKTRVLYQTSHVQEMMSHVKEMISTRTEASNSRSAPVRMEAGKR